MKSLSWAVLGLLMAAPSFAADNNIKMVTYFPVPYAAYGDLGVTGTCDVGLMGQCKFNGSQSFFGQPCAEHGEYYCKKRDIGIKSALILRDRNQHYSGKRDRNGCIGVFA